MNKEKITSIYKLTNKQIYNDDIGHIKPLIGKSKILLNKSGYTIDNKKYSLEEGKKLIEKASTEHPRKVYRNNQLLNGFYFVLQKSDYFVFYLIKSFLKDHRSFRYASLNFLFAIS